MENILKGIISHNTAKNFPHKPGVYIFRDGIGDPIYIGKAKDLKKRVNSYFIRGANRSRHGKINALLREARKLDYIITPTEKEAFLLEANLIYEYKPKYNVALKAEQVYPYIRITNERFPRLEIVRRKGKNGIYFGPYTSIGTAKALIGFAQKCFKIRSCRYDLNHRRLKKPCLEYHLGYCSAPCIGKISEEDYTEDVKKTRAIFEGNLLPLKERLQVEMKRLSKLLEFEKAVRIRDLLNNIDAFFAEQHVEVNEKVDVDIIAYEGDFVEIFKIRHGLLLGKMNFRLVNGDIEDFFYQYYFAKEANPPRKVYINRMDDEKKKEIAKILYNSKIVLRYPRKREYKALLNMCIENLHEEERLYALDMHVLEQMKEKLGLKRLPVRIEGIDISHTHGVLTTASLITFENGKPLKEEYRRYRISELKHPDDYEAISMVLRRRYSKMPLPDLLFIDGGKGQVNTAFEILREMGTKRQDIVGIAKEDERIVFPGLKEDLHLPMDDVVLRLLIRVRDECHRFAHKYHTSLRDRELSRSRLDGIRGIGPKRKKSLLRKYGSIKNITRASVDELASLPGMNKSIARELLKALREE
ncbi:MAG: excinuclease ABC subunit UvrC [Thermotogae bacterium]|nr:excinuclease ABC subunit UvrC [Thermotogota bacterium]